MNKIVPFIFTRNIRNINIYALFSLTPFTPPSSSPLSLSPRLNPPLFPQGISKSTMKSKS